MRNLGIILSRPCFIVNLTWMEITMHCSDTCKWSIIFINFKSMTGACLPCDSLYKWFIFLPLFIFLLDRILCMSYAYMILENVLVCYERKNNLSLRCLLNKITVFGVINCVLLILYLKVFSTALSWDCCSALLIMLLVY